jgi:hypothetical protein
MFINKMGFEHYLYGINNQDFGFCTNNLKLVCDGCSEGKHSEVGVKLFCYEVENNHLSFPDAMDKISKYFSSYLDYMLFTILGVEENDENFITVTCGDGYLILIDYNNKLTIKEIDGTNIDNNPIYYAYNYIDESKLINLKHSDIDFECKVFSKSEYKNVGVATDGLRYIFGEPFEEEFKKLLVEGKEIQIKRLINKYSNVFKDDITISL